MQCKSCGAPLSTDLDGRVRIQGKVTVLDSTLISTSLPDKLELTSPEV